MMGINRDKNVMVRQGSPLNRIAHPIIIHIRTLQDKESKDRSCSPIRTIFNSVYPWDKNTYVYHVLSKYHKNCGL